MSTSAIQGREQSAHHVQLSDMPSPAILTHELTKQFGTLTAVDHVNLTVPTGAVFGLLGPDGAGKSTLLRMVATVLSPTSGDANVLGQSVTTAAGRVRHRLGYMPQRFCMYPDLTVDENIAFFATVRGIPKEVYTQRRDTVLAHMGMADFGRRRAGRLSGGMKQKLMLAVTLLTEPAVLLLDEPTTGVDPVSRREFWDILTELRGQGTTIVVATPYMDEAERCTNLAFLDQGRITHTGTPREIEDAVPGVLLEVTVPQPRELVSRAQRTPGVLSAHVFGEVVRVVWTGRFRAAADLNVPDTVPDVPAEAARVLDVPAGATRVLDLLGAAAAVLDVPVDAVREVEMDMETAFTVLAESSDRSAEPSHWSPESSTRPVESSPAEGVIR